MIEARRKAEREATKLRPAAEAERAAADLAAALREEAQAEAEAISISASAKKTDLLAEADGRQALANSGNTLSPEIVAMRIALARLEAMPKIVEEMVKPAEKIDSIRINQISGLGGANVGGAEGGKAPVNQAFDAMLGAALQLPVMKKLGEEIGINFDAALAACRTSRCPPKSGNRADRPALRGPPQKGGTPPPNRSREGQPAAAKRAIATRIA